MNYCVKCDAEIPDDSVLCENCISAVNEKKPSKKIFLPIIFIIIVVVSIAVYLISSNCRYNKEMERFNESAKRMANTTKQYADAYQQQIDQEKEDALEKEISKGRRGEPMIGMTSYQARNTSWGEPRKINKTTNTYGTSEQWVYSNNRYLYFDDGILVSISE